MQISELVQINHQFVQFAIDKQDICGKVSGFEVGTDLMWFCGLTVCDRKGAAGGGETERNAIINIFFALKRV